MPCVEQLVLLCASPQIEDYYEVPEALQEPNGLQHISKLSVGLKTLVLSGGCRL